MLVREGRTYGDVSKFRIVAHTKNGEKDISQAIMNVNLYQSIFTYFWSAELSVNDTVNLRTLLPLERGMRIDITVGTKVESLYDEEKTYTLVLQSINSGNYTNHQQTTYTLNLVDESVILDSSAMISECYKNMYHDQIISKIVKDYLIGYKLDADNTTNAITCLIPNWKPFHAISWLTKSALNRGNADFFFFQYDNKAFRFASLEDMYKSSKYKIDKIEFNRKPTNISTLHRTYDYSFNTMRIYTEYFDVGIEINNGYMGSVVYKYDQIRKKMIKTSFNAKSDMSYDENDTYNPILENTMNTSVEYMPVMNGAYLQGQTVNETANEWIPTRKIALLKADRNKLVIQTTGVAGAWRLLGMNCKVNLPSQQDIEDEMYDKDYTGDYLITDITHMINREVYMINYSLIKKAKNERG